MKKLLTMIGAAAIALATALPSFATVRCHPCERAKMEIPLNLPGDEGVISRRTFFGVMLVLYHA